MQKPSNLILLVDVPADAAQEYQRLAAELGQTCLLIAVAENSAPTPTPVPLSHSATTKPAPNTGNDPFRLTEPDYDCLEHEIMFNSTGGDEVEYMAPGVTSWTKDPGPHKVDAGVAKDSTHLTLYARQNGVECSPYQFAFRAYCQKR